MPGLHKDPRAHPIENLTAVYGSITSEDWRAIGKQALHMVIGLLGCFLERQACDNRVAYI
jgi:hypothetical protein